MARDTPDDVASLVVYQVFARQHGPNGTLADVTADLERIAALGVDVVYLLPVQPIGLVGRKGSLGSPFAITDFRAVNPDLGTEDDFVALVDRAHELGLRVILDVVFNHTAPDSHLVVDHPEFYHRDADGQPYSSMPQWTDIIDLAHPDPALTRFLIDALAGWVRRGVDGFRCDSAALTPLDFWLQARRELAQLRPGLLWVAESVHPNLVEDRRARGFETASDNELFEAFDAEYTYDVWPVWQSAVRGDVPVGRYLEMLRWQDVSYPANYVKLRHVENHDNFRITRFAASREQAVAWTALTAFLRGAFMIYAGQESGTPHWPTLFDHDPIDWGDFELSPLITRLAALKKHDAVRTGTFVVLGDAPCVQLAWGRRVDATLAPTGGGAGLYGVFNVAASSDPVVVQLPDGTYRDLLADTDVTVRDGLLAAPETAVVLEIAEAYTVAPWQSPLLDVFFHVEHLGDA